MPRKTDKRVRLIEAAKVLIHRQGFSLTTLADIAQEADVPLGNVYYYFKTKESIGIAVIERLAAEFTEMFARFNEITDPAARLSAYVEKSIADLEPIARYGCPIGGLCQELGKKGGSLADLAAKVLNEALEWSEEQFKQLGFADRAKELAVTLVSNIQGMRLLTHTFKDPKISELQAKALVANLEQILGVTLPKAIQTPIVEEAVY